MSMVKKKEHDMTTKEQKEFNDAVDDVEVVYQWIYDMLGTKAGKYNATVIATACLTMAANIVAALPHNNDNEEVFMRAAKVAFRSAEVYMKTTKA